MLKLISFGLLFATATLGHAATADETQIWNLEKAYWEYVKANDLEKYRALWHDDFVGWPSVSPTPVRKDHITDWITAKTSKGVKLQSYSIEELAICVTGDVAIDHYRVKYVWVSSQSSDGETQTSRITHTWLRSHGTWQILGGMSAPVNSGGARLGIFDMSWNILCPACGGVLDSGATLKTVKQAEYTCVLCAEGCEPTLDDIVEVTFTISPRVRRIAAHDPGTLSFIEYYRQVFWSSGVDLPDDEALAKWVKETTLDAIELSAGEKVVLSLQLPEGYVIVFDPVLHMSQHIEVTGETTRERQSLSFVMTRDHAPSGPVQMRPGPLQVTLENRLNVRTLPAIWIVSDKVHELVGKRRPFLTAKHLLTNQTFRDIYRTDTLDVDQRLKITSLSFLFTDLKGSTELYERVGDLVAYDLVRAHFRILNEIVAAERGAVVKTIGDAVMATFPTPDRAMAAALKMRKAVKDLKGDLLLKIGIHEGPCLAVSLNDRQDYFGRTVNIAARVQGLATSRSIFATRRIVSDSEASKLLESNGIAATPEKRSLRGIAKQIEIFEIP